MTRGNAIELRPASVFVRNVVERCGAAGAAFLPLRAGLIGASDVVVHGLAGERCLASLARRSLVLPEAPVNGGCAAVSLSGPLESSARIWLAAAFDETCRPTALLAATSPAPSEELGGALIQALEEARAQGLAGGHGSEWPGEIGVLESSGRASNLLASAVAARGEILLLTPSLSDATGLLGSPLGKSVVDLAHGDQVAERIRALASELEDPQGSLKVVSRRTLVDGTRLLWLEELAEARLERKLELFAQEHRLTQAERAALQDIARGLSAKESALRLSLSPETVRARRKRIFRKVDADGCGAVMAQLLGSAARREH
ncbi:MAG: helix-turn-helix transcriptional regulator [Deltaproteobacteria bacterium]